MPQSTPDIEKPGYIHAPSPLSAVDGVQQLQQQPLLSYSGASPEQQQYQQQQALLASPPPSTLRPYVSPPISRFPFFDLKADVKLRIPMTRQPSRMPSSTPRPRRRLTHPRVRRHLLRTTLRCRRIIVGLCRAFRRCRVAMYPRCQAGMCRRCRVGMFRLPNINISSRRVGDINRPSSEFLRLVSATTVTGSPTAPSLSWNCDFRFFRYPSLFFSFLRIFHLSVVSPYRLGLSTLYCTNIASISM